MPNQRIFKLLPGCCALLCGLAAVGCGSRKPPETAPPSPEANVAAAPPAAAVETRTAPMSVHTVQPGDTLWSLSRRYGVTVEDFVRANDLVDPDDLSVGEQLVVPINARTGLWVWPVAGGTLLSGFGEQRGVEVHRGVDIDAEPGQQVRAAAPGIVVYAGGDMRDYGNAVIIDHGRGLTTLYGHNAELMVREGDRVTAGQPIALAGRSGNATTVHCHFEVRRGAVALDPLEFLAASGQ